MNHRPKVWTERRRTDVHFLIVREKKCIKHRRALEIFSKLLISMSNSASTSYNNVSGSSNTVSNKSTGSNSNQNETAKRIRHATRARFRAEGQPESWWNPHWYYTNQVRRRAKRAENVLKYPSEKLVPRIPFRNLLKIFYL
jgi:hypothetical protein